jgi:hypothetical protein
MGRPRLGENLKKPSDYSYDYPAQREIAKQLLFDDKIRMAETSGLTIRTVRCWCEGTRKNARLMELALRYAEINKETILEKGKVTINK